MRIAIPVDEEKEGSQVCVSFGRTPFFLIYDSDTKEIEFLTNEAANSSGGAGPKAAQSIVDQDVSVLLTPRCGENAAAVLEDADIAIYKTIKDSACKNIEAYEAGKLQPLSEIHAGFHKHGGQ